MIFFLWIMLYGIVYTLSEMLSELLEVRHIITVPSMLVYWCILIHYLKKHNHTEACYICAPKIKKISKYFVYAPLLLMPMINVAIFVHKSHTMNIISQIQDINIISVLNWLLLTLLTISCVVGEELIFRGILLSALMKHCPIKKRNAILASSAIFASMHILNMFSGASLNYVMLQILNAGAVGFCLAIVCCLEYSIVPCIVIHSLINISSLLIDKKVAVIADTGYPALSNFELKFFILLPPLYALYGWYLYQKGKDRKRI